MNIKEVAAKLGIQPSAIRYYEEQDLLIIPRSESGYRAFDASIIQRLSLIVSLKKLNFSVKDIRLVMNFMDRPESQECNLESRAYWGQLIAEAERDLEEKFRILNTLKEVYELSSTHQAYEQNKERIVELLTQT